MDIEIAKVFKKYSECEVREDYSGRGMYGRETCGILVDDERNFFQILSAIMMCGNEEERDLVGDYLLDIHEDTMGLDRIYY